MKPKLLNFDEFSRELVSAIKNAKQNITISVMVAYADPATATVFDEIKRALKRGVRVKIFLDNYAKAFRTEDIVNRLRYWPKTKQFLSEYSQNGAEVVFGGRVGLNPFAGRIHQKVYLIDDVAYVGGVNLSFDKPSNDLMVKIKDQKLVNWLANWLKTFFADQQNLPTKYKVNDKTTILMDNRLKSPIYEEFTRLAKECSRAQISSRMCPSGPAMKFLAGKRIKYYFNPISNMALPSKIAILWDIFRYKIKNSYQGDKYIHAKCALFDNKIAIISSNNFNYMGVKWRTTEVGLVSTDKSLVNAVKKFFDEL